MAEKDFLNPDEDVQFDGSADGMENMVLNLEEVDEDGPAFEALPPGIYNCVVENTEFAPSKKNNPMITWVFKVVDPEFENRLLFNHTVLNHERGRQRLKQILMRVVPEVNMAEFNPQKFCDEGVAIGYPCRVKVRIRPYQGEKRNDVTDVLAPVEGSSFLDE